MIVVDMNSGENDWVGRDADFLDWLRAHGIEPSLVYRAEIDLEEDHLKIFSYSVNEEGKKFYKPEPGEGLHSDKREVAVEEPYEITINVNQVVPGIFAAANSREEA